MIAPRSAPAVTYDRDKVALLSHTPLSRPAVVRENLFNSPGSPFEPIPTASLRHDIDNAKKTVKFTIMKTVISASRRTDIPACYMSWFLSCLSQGLFEVENPFTRKDTIFRFRPGDIHSIVFWSKNYGALLREKNPLKRYNLYFHFTINTPVPVFDPGIPPLAERLAQARELAGWRDAAHIMWRFDPVVVWEEAGVRKNNLASFLLIAAELKKIGVTRLTLSMMDRYRKIDRRTVSIEGFRFIYPDSAEAGALLKPFIESALDMGFEVGLCCEKELLLSLSQLSVKQGRCIDGKLLSALFGEGADTSPDRGQRKSLGCGCTVSFDIGSYSRQPCRNNCLYCYANPESTARYIPE